MLDIENPKIRASFLVGNKGTSELVVTYKFLYGRKDKSAMLKLAKRLCLRSIHFAPFHRDVCGIE